jgi:hypothetical protein
MEQILYIVLGAFLALLGGIITQLFQDYQQQIKKDWDLLYEAQDNLLKHHPLSVLENDLVKKANLRYELNDIAIRIKSKRYRNLAVELMQFALDDNFRKEEKLESLTRKVQKSINKLAIMKYEKMTKELQEQAKKALENKEER